MPDKNKRRKQKNKRKNKNRPDPNKITSDSSEPVNIEPNTTDITDTNLVLETDSTPNVVTSDNSMSEAKHELLNISDEPCVVSSSENQDSNNNSSSSEPQSVTVLISSVNVDTKDELSVDVKDYLVESPENSLKSSPKHSSVKSKSFDDDEPKIVEIIDEINSKENSDFNTIDSSNAPVEDSDTNAKWVNTDEFEIKQSPPTSNAAQKDLSDAFTRITKAQCDENKSLTPEAEKALRSYLQTLDLSTSPMNVDSLEIKSEIEYIINREIKHRLSKKSLADDFLCPKPIVPRVLDVIDEESSESSSVASRRQSRLSDKKSDIEDFDDDVFEEGKKKKLADKYNEKLVNTFSSQKLIPQQCVLVGAKLKDPDVTEARGDWALKTVEKMAGAELVYLTDSSSSTSSIHEIIDETDDGIDTDVSVRMITPTIEVTDADVLLKKSFTLPDDQSFPKKSKMENENAPLIESISEIQKNVDINKNSNLNSHEILVSSTDNIRTDLYVKNLSESNRQQNDLIENDPNLEMVKKNKINENIEGLNHEMNSLKCELNSAMNNLIKEVSSDAESSSGNAKDNFARQDSSSSVCSSQCTEKYNPNYSSLIDVSNTMHDETNERKGISNYAYKSDINSHVNDVFEYVAGRNTKISHQGANQPSDLRDLCLKKIVSLPYGERILEELADVSQRLQNITLFGSHSNNSTNLNFKDSIPGSNQRTQTSQKMPYYPLPDLSSIETVSLETKHREPLPPPVQPRNSSLKKSQDDHWTGLPTRSEPVYVCLSPSQKMLMEKTNTVITKDDASDLVDMHKKFVDRRGYNEYYSKDKNKDNVINTPVVPFKSQSGSRLLALIRDPTVTNNISSPVAKRYNSSLDNLNFPRKHANVEKMSKRINEQFHSIKDFSDSFKPIPPPRPRKCSSSFYESDESSEFTDSSLRSVKSERKFFHYSTGNLNKDIENDVSSIQNLHRNYTNIRDAFSQDAPRRPSLPKDLCEQQMDYIRKKEKEIEAEIRRLEDKHRKTSENRGPRAPLIKENENNNNFILKTKESTTDDQRLAQKGDKTKLSSVFSSSQEEILREKMYSEYMNQMAARQERKQQKVIKITNHTSTSSQKVAVVSKSMSALDVLDSKVNNPIEKEFISKARERWDKLGIKDPETEDERESMKEKKKDTYAETEVTGREHKIKVIDGGEEKDVQKLPSHLQDFVRFTAKDKEGKDSPETVMIAPTFKARSASPAVWRPSAPTPPPTVAGASSPAAGAPSPAVGAQSPAAGVPSLSSGVPPPPPPPPAWAPNSAGPSPQAPRKTFKPVNFEDTRRKFESADQNGFASGSDTEGRLRTSHSAPAAGLNTLGSSRLPRAQNPTVTLLQKAREGQFPRGSQYLQSEHDRLPRDRPAPPKGDPVYALRKEYASEGEEYVRGPRKMATAPRKVEGIGPTTKDGMPVALRSEVKDPSRWYKKMYDTIHKNKHRDDQPTQRYTNKSQYAYFDPRSGYLSEPEGGSRVGSAWSDAYDSDVTSGPRRRTASVQEDRRIHEEVTSPYLPSNKYSTLASARASSEVYKNQPRRIEDYVPGKSSVLEKEAKQWWDEVMDIFDGWLDENSPLPPYSTLLARAMQKSNYLSSTLSLPQSSPREKKDVTSSILSKSNMARALKESGYESDSTLIFRRRDETEAPLSPAERRAAYRDLQAGGEPPLRGFRSPAPPRQDETEIEYIPITSTLTKIRVHKKTPDIHEVVCYPADKERRKFKKQIPSFISVDVHNPPAPPRRVSSKNSRTLRLITNTRPARSSSPKRIIKNQSNVDFLKDKISHKLSRQNTQIIIKRGVSNPNLKSIKTRITSTSAPPALNRKINNPKSCVKNMNGKSGTSSFLSPRKTLQPTEYNSSKYGGPQTSVVIEGGAGRRTPITNILDKVTPLDKLWSSERRNERIDLVKARTKSALRGTSNNAVKVSPAKIWSPIGKYSGPTHKSRDMTRTAEKLQNRLKISNVQTKSNPCLSSNTKNLKPSALHTSSNISKSSSNIAGAIKRPNQVKTAVVTNLKKKKSLESVIIKSRSVPCYNSCSKKSNKDVKNTKKDKPKNGKKVTSKSSNESGSGSQFGDLSNDVSFGSIDNFVRKTISAKDIKRTREAVLSDSFFQHLFLGNTCYSSCSLPLVDIEPNTTVLQKAKMFQSYPLDVMTPRSINSYLIHRKPVSLSRFTLWDQYASPLRGQSPRSISWPGRKHEDVEKMYMLKCKEFGSTSSLATVRSKSEPPDNKLYFSQTSRPKSPTVVFCKKRREIPIRDELSPTRLYFSETSRPVSPVVVRKVEKPSISTRPKSKSPSRIVFSETVRPISPSVIKLQTPDILECIPDENESRYPSTIYFSQTSRPVSPKVIKNTDQIRNHSASPLTVRSPSYRRITSRLQNGRHHGETRTNLRTRSAGDADKKDAEDKLLKTISDSNLRDPDYDEYLEDMKNNRARSERFRELNRYYAYLERVAELERTTSTCDLRHRRKDEEIIDFDRWKKIRAIERAEEELNNLYRKLKIAQNENDVLFYPRDVKDFRWSYDRDRGLKIKEKSVEDLKDHFQQMSYYDTHEPELLKKDTYKPLWRGTSVAETAFVINRKNENDESRPLVKPVIVHHDSTLNDLRREIGIGNRLWSSLSLEQVKALKHQLNAIYSRELESKQNKVNDKYIIDVNDRAKAMTKPMLHVRSNSLSSSPPPIKTNELLKSESIAAISCPTTSVKELKNNVNKIQMSLTESEKRRISQRLSREVLDRVNRFENATPPLSLKQEMENSHEKNKCIDNKDESPRHSNVSITEPIVEFPDYPKGDNSRHLVFPPEKTESQNQSSASETETASSDISNKTVVFRGPKREVKKKVEYFETIKQASNRTSIIYHARDSSGEKSDQDQPESIMSSSTPVKEIEKSKSLVQSQSQSCTNIKELFGESEKNKFLSLPSKPEVRSRSASPQSEVCVSDRQTPDTLRYSSDETVWRSRSPSPDPERYWRAYLNLAKAGEVHRLARRFDSPSATGAVLRRHRSDPEIHRDGSHKPKYLPPVAKIPLRPTNRYMPHIDIISKLASLRRRTTPRSRSAEETPECRPGEVERMRRRFETMSILGQIYASAPDVSELRDIAYLSGPWIAHQYPKRSDNNRSVKDPSSFICGRISPVRKEDKIKKVKKSAKLSSILKNEVLGNQEFDPLAHQPKSRYEPPRAPSRPPPAAWPRLASYILPRHSVKFKESDGPEPPRRTQHGSYSDTESPRRYVESDVNIHYRVPVRRDPLPLVPERELARQQAEHMKRLYREQKRNKYLQENDIHPNDIEAFDASIKELQDMQNRRHQDNFTPSQKNILPLNRYDEAAKITARALYTFNGQTNRELSFRKGDVIHVRRQIDANWYEGEVHGRIGLFPYNYVEIIKGDSQQSPKKPTTIEGRARAKFDFTAQTNLELPLKKGELVVLTRRIDHNWWEGRNGTKTGIFPDSYVTVLQEPSHNKPEHIIPITVTNTNKPMASPAAHGLLNGSAKHSMGSHTYTPQLNSPALSNAPQPTQPLLPVYQTKPSKPMQTPSERGYGPPTAPGVDLNNREPLYVDTNAEAVPYRVMYKYRPQNPDELELNEGDTVYVLEQCDDGWYVGSSQRTGRFGTFPGNYVERI